MIRPFFFLSVLSLSSLLMLPSCGGGGSSEAPLEESLPSHKETIKPSIIRLGNECIITIGKPVQHPLYEATIVFIDDMMTMGQLSYKTSSLSYLVDMNDAKKVTINTTELTPSTTNLASRKYSVRANLTFTSTTEGIVSWEIEHGPSNPADRQTKTGSGSFTVSEN